MASSGLRDRLKMTPGEVQGIVVLLMICIPLESVIPVNPSTGLRRKLFCIWKGRSRRLSLSDFRPERRSHCPGGFGHCSLCRANARFHRCAVVLDMVYNPLKTPLLKLARSRGIPAVGGLKCLRSRGARQFEIWRGKPARESEMMRVVERGLRKRA